MTIAIDKAGRVVIPVEIRRRLGLEPGTELELTVEGYALRLVRAVEGPEIRQREKRLIASPRVSHDDCREIDVARLVEEERARSTPWRRGRSARAVRPGTVVSSSFR